MTQTEKLRAEIFKALEDNAWETDQIDAILESCKKSGLKFTQVGVVGDDLEGAYICKLEEIEL